MRNPRGTPRGRAQAEKLRERFQPEEFAPTAVYSSPLLRAAQTAEILARPWPVWVTHWDDLKEHDVGVISGLTREETQEKYPDVDFELETARQFAGIEGAEPLADRRARGNRVIDSVLDRHSNEDVVVLVTHGGILQQLLAAVMKTSRTWGLSVGNTAVFDFTIDMSRWDLGGGDLANTAICRIDAFNDTAHLQDD